MEEGASPKNIRLVNLNPIQIYCPLNVSSESTEELYPIGSPLAKKRKLEYELNDSCLPSPKHKFRDRINVLDYECSRTESIGFVCNFIDEGSDSETRNKVFLEGTRNKVEEQESDKNSNNIMEECNANIGLDTEERTEDLLCGKNLIWDLPSTSSSSSNNVFTSSFVSPTCNNTKIGKSTEQHNLEKVEPEYDSIKGLNNVLETYDDDQIIAELVKDNMDGFNKVIDDAMLYSNGVNHFLLSQNLQDDMQDLRASAKKLTIDQEFEQYFSMLML